MTDSLVDRIVAATLYEGYVLYPYRPSSVKNQVRWTFGGVYPRAYSEAIGGAEPWFAQTQCLVRGAEGAQIGVRVRFLQLMTRTPGMLASPLPALAGDQVPPHRAVESVRVDGTLHRGWEEAVEREVACGAHTLADLLSAPRLVPLEIPSGRSCEPLREPGVGVTAVLVRSWEPLTASAEISASRIAGDLARITVRVSNLGDLGMTGDDDQRSQALRRSLVSCHVVLTVSGGRWLSLADPPDDAREAAGSCSNVGLWPVLVGEPGDDQTVLASPIILEDHPRVAPESAGELFDSTEIDEILSLRILALTDAEKEEMRTADPRTRAILERTESLSAEAMLGLHGTIRELRPTRGEMP